MDIFNTLPEVLNNQFSQGFLTISAVIGAASMFVKALALVAKITPSSKDDVLVGKLEAGLSKVVRIVDIIALNPDVRQARLPKKRK